MHHTNIVRQPEALKVGAKYKLETETNQEHQFALEEVRFLSYTSSPEIVVVQTFTGRKLRVARYNIYEDAK